MKVTRHCCVVLHVAFEDLDAFAPVIESRGYRLDYLQAGVDDLLSDRCKRADLVVIMGGPIGANDEAKYPFLTDELKLIGQRIHRKLPTLGICLGGQLIARALGARVYLGDAPELGWHPLTLSKTATGSCMQSLAGEHTKVLHWHNDCFDLPENAVHLASTALCPNQAFAFEQNTLALQFHPEISERGFERWLIGHAEQITHTNKSVADLRKQTALNAPIMASRSRQFLTEWLQIMERTDAA